MQVAKTQGKASEEMQSYTHCEKGVRAQGGTHVLNGSSYIPAAKTFGLTAAS